MTEIMALSPNRWPGALANRRYAVMHTTEGTSSLGWLRNPDSMVSATLLVPRDGPDWWRLGADTDAMWHAGIVSDPVTDLYDGVNPNLEAPGIELEGFATQPITLFQIQTAVGYLEPWGVPPIMHAWLATTGPYYRSDPGVDNFAAIIAALNGGGDVATLTREDVKDVIREMLRAQEGSDLVEFAIRYQGGYAEKLQAWLNVNVLARLPKMVRAGKRAAAVESPFTPIVPQQHPTGQKGEWDPALGPEPVAPQRTSSGKGERG
jgi:hypothetical protein